MVFPCSLSRPVLPPLTAVRGRGGAVSVGGGEGQWTRERPLGPVINWGEGGYKTVYGRGRENVNPYKKGRGGGEKRF